MLSKKKSYCLVLTSDLEEKIAYLIMMIIAELAFIDSITKTFKFIDSSTYSEAMIRCPLRKPHVWAQILSKS